MALLLTPLAVCLALLVFLTARSCQYREPAANADVSNLPVVEELPFGMVVRDIKGVDFSDLDENQKIKTLKLMNIIPCLAGDGRISVARCRRDVPHCITSQRMADYILHSVKEGMPEEKILTSLYEKALRDGGAVATLDDKRTGIEELDLPMLGKKTAPVRITLFYDYTSTFSKQAWEEVSGLNHLYPNRVRVVMWPFPRSKLDPKAEKAARVALAAHELGVFSVVHPLLVENAGELSDGKLDGYTEAAGLAPDVLNNAAISPEIRNKIAILDRKAAALGVTSSPAVFVAGRRIRGAVPSTCMLVGAVQEVLADYVIKEYSALTDRIAPM